MRQGKYLLVLLLTLFVALAGCKQAGDESGGEEKEEKAEGEEAEGEGGGEGAEEGGDEAEGDDEGDEESGDDSGDETAAADDSSGDAAKMANVEVSSDFISQIPADTPYFWGTVETLAWDEVPMNFEDWGPMLETVSKQMKESGDSDVGAKLLGALLDEMKGNMNEEGLKKLGFKTDGAHMALYGVGVFPVFRMELGDGQAFADMYARVEKEAGGKAEMKKLGDIEYRVYDGGDAKVVVALLPNQVIATIAPEPALEWLLPYALGTKKPEKSLADAGTLETLAGKYGKDGAKGLSLGYIDLLSIQKTLSGEEKGMLAESMGKAGMPTTILEGPCKTEFGMLATAMPRFVYSGFYLENAMHAGFTLEMPESVVGEIKGVRATVPGLGQTPDGAVAVLGLGLDVQKSIAWLGKYSKMLQDKPFECGMLKDVNQMAAELQGVASGQVPPPVLALKGLRVVLNDIKFDPAKGPSDVKGLALIQSSDAAGLWAMAAGLLKLPGADKVTAGGKAVSFGTIPGAEFLGEVSVQMSKETIAASMGGEQGKLDGFMKAAPADDAPLLAFGYDYGKFFSVLEGTMQGGDAQMMKQMMKAYETFGFTTFGLGVNDNGLELSYHINFNEK